MYRNVLKLIPIFVRNTAGCSFGVAVCTFIAASLVSPSVYGKTVKVPPGEYPVVEDNLVLGGPFSLIDHLGNSVTDQSYRGRHMLIYFGYTFCPDICPTGLQILVQALEFLGDDAYEVQPLFISVDPRRDTVEVLSEYVSTFHPRLVGLTGTAQQVYRAAKAYGVHYAIAKHKGKTLVDHTAGTYLTGPDGTFLTEFSHGIEPEEMAAAIRQWMRKAQSVSTERKTQ